MKGNAMSILILRIVMFWFISGWFLISLILLSKLKLKTTVFLILAPILVFTKNGRDKLSKLL